MVSRRAGGAGLPVDGYVRVSRVGLRRGDRFISPLAQRDAIEAWAARTGVRLGEIFDELDESGDRFDRPVLGNLVERVEQGVSRGVVVDKVDRFGRSLVHGVLMIERIRAAGGTVYAVHESLDSDTDAGRLMLRHMLSTAEWELDRRRAAWETARRYAIARGVHQGSRTPLGYRKTRSGRLRPHPVTAALVSELFERRAAGESLGHLGRWLEARGVATSWGNPGWAASTVRQLLRNPVYLGQVRSGPFVRENAHPRLTDPATWQRAQEPVRPAPMTARPPALLAGIARCAGCGRPMVAHQRRHPSTARDDDSGYSCPAYYPAGRCPAPAHITATQLDALVHAAMIRLLNRRRQRPCRQLADAERALEATQHALVLYRDGDRVLMSLGVDAYAAGLAARIDRVRSARLALAASRARNATHQLPAAAQVQAAWPTMDRAARRRLIGVVVDCVFVRNGRLSPEERVTICPAGTAPANLPSRRDAHSRLHAFQGPIAAHDAATVTEWDPALLRDRLRRFTRGQRAWPSAAEFRSRGRAALHRQAVYQGGERYWALRLGLTYNQTNQRSGPWTEERVHATLRVVLANRTRWPSTQEFDAAGLRQLRVAIARTGGSHRWAREFAIPFAHYPKGHWSDEQIRDTLTALRDQLGHFPTHTELKQANLGGLVAVLNHAHSGRYWANEIAAPQRN